MVSQAPEGPRGEVASLVPPRPGEDKPAPEAPAAIPHIRMDGSGT